MDVLRTPDERFVGLADFDFDAHYVDVAAGDGSDTALRVHHLDEGPADGPVALLLHGEPTWSYLYRHMVPVLAGAGLRCIVPDLVGFGRSDKPASRDDHTYARHVEWMREALFDRLGLDDITLFGQDWGSLIGLRLVGEHPARFSRVVIGNGFLPTGDTSPGDAFFAWRKFSQETPEFPVGAIVNSGCTTELSEAVVAGYDAPFPDESYKEGPRAMPALVPTTPDDPASEANRRAWETLEGFDKPFLTSFGDADPILGNAYRPLRERIPGAQGQPHTTIEGGGHFLQEDRGPQLAQVIVDFVAG